MIRAVLHRLRGDTALSALLGASGDDSRIYPLTAPNFGPCLTYSLTPFASGVVSQSRVEIRAIAPSFAQCEAIGSRVTKLLGIPEDEPGWWYDGISIHASTLTGGGALEYEGADVYQWFGYFNMKWSVNNGSYR